VDVDGLYRQYDWYGVVDPDALSEHLTHYQMVHAEEAEARAAEQAKRREIASCGNRAAAWAAAAVAGFVVLLVLVLTGVLSGWTLLALAVPGGAALWWTSRALAAGTGHRKAAALLGRAASSLAELSGRPDLSTVRFTEFDDVCRALARRVRVARDTVLEARVYADDHLDNRAGALALRWHEWQIALRLREISSLRTAHADIAQRHARMQSPPTGLSYHLRDPNAELRQGSPDRPDEPEEAVGPVTSAYLLPQHRVLDSALGAVQARITAMEKYAAKVKQADAALLDWQTAREASGLNGRFLDLAARSEADDLAVRELEHLTNQAEAAGETFRNTLREANLAAEPLAFEDDRRNPAQAPPP
jgi:hypothetical protein